MNNKKIVIRPFSSKRGIGSLYICTLIATVTLVTSITIMTLTANYKMLFLFIIISLVLLIPGIILFFIFPRVKIVFDPLQRNVTVKSNKTQDKIILFTDLQPFRIYEVLRGYAHQYYCNNASFGEYSDLFFSSLPKKILKKAKQLQKLTGAMLINYDGDRVQPE
jgi:hypothetical protein